MTRSSKMGMVAVLVVLGGWKALVSEAQSQQAPPAAAQTGPKELSNQEINDAFAQKISKQIAGHEEEPAGQVFKNIQVLKKTPAGRLLLIMNQGYSRALGVNCKHCHVEDDFSKDDKRPKRCARDMQQVHFHQPRAREDAKPGTKSQRALHQLLDVPPRANRSNGA